MRKHPVGLALRVALMALVPLTSCGDDSTAPSEDSGLGDSGTVDARAGEDRNVSPSDARVWDASTSVCGNGVVEEGEVCDDGNTVSGDGCNSTCSLQDAWDRVVPTLTAGDQNEPAVACGDDSFLVVWTDWNGLDGDGASIQVRLYHSDGLAMAIQGSDEQRPFNLSGAGHQYGARAAALPGGGYAVVWTDGSRVGDVKLRFVEPDGTFGSSEILVNSVTAGDQRSPSIAVSDSGTILVVWVDGSGLLGDPSGYGIAARLFDETGRPVTNGVTGDASEFLVNTVTSGIQRDPDVAALDTGGFLVVWSDGSGMLDDDGYGVAARVLDATGVGQGPEFLVNSHTRGLQVLPRVTRQRGLGAVVVWTDGSLTDDLEDFGIRARLLDPTGTFRTSASGSDEDFPVNQAAAGTQETPAVAANPQGYFFVVWLDWSGRDGSGAGISGRMLDDDGGPLATFYARSGEDFQVDTTFVGSQTQPAVCSLANWYVAAWTDESGQPPDEEGSTVRIRLVPGS